MASGSAWSLRPGGDDDFRPIPFFLSGKNLSKEMPGVPTADRANTRGGLYPRRGGATSRYHIERLEKNVCFAGRSVFSLSCRSTGEVARSSPESARPRRLGSSGGALDDHCCLLAAAAVRRVQRRKAPASNELSDSDKSKLTRAERKGTRSSSWRRPPSWAKPLHCYVDLTYEPDARVCENLQPPHTHTTSVGLRLPQNKMTQGLLDIFVDASHLHYPPRKNATNTRKNDHCQMRTNSIGADGGLERCS